MSAVVSDGRLVTSTLLPNQADGEDRFPVGRDGGPWTKAGTFILYNVVASGADLVHTDSGGLGVNVGYLAVDTETGRCWIVDKSTIGGGGSVAFADVTGDADDNASLVAYVTSRINAVIAAAPGALDTLDELAAALGDDASFATTVTNALALKAPLVSPAFTGNPTAPTQAPADNSTRLATTAYADAAAAAVTSAAVLRPDPAVDLSLVDAFLDTGADLQPTDYLAVVGADGGLRRLRADALYASAVRTRTTGDDLLDLRPYALYWPDLSTLFSSAAQTTRTIDSNPTTAFPGQDQDVQSWADVSGNSRHITNQIVSPGRLTVDFTDTGLPAVQSGSNFTLGRSGESALFGSPWTAVLAVSQNAADASFAQVAFSVGKSTGGSNDYVALITRRTDIGGATGGNVTHRFFGSVSGGWSSTLDDGNIADPGRDIQVHAVGWDGANFWFRKQDGSILTSAGTFAGADQFGIGWLYRSSYGFYMTGHTAALGLFPRSLTAAERTRVVTEFKRRLLAPPRLTDRVAFCSRLGGAASSKTRRNEKPVSSLAATVGTVGVAAPATNGSGPGADVSGGAALKVGRATFGRFAGWPSRGNWFVAFHGTIDTLPGSGDSHLVGQWAQAGRVWRLVVTSTGAVRADLMTVPTVPTIKTITDSAGLTNGSELRVVLAWNRDLQQLELNVNARTQVTASYSGPDWSINSAEPTTAVTVGAGWSGTGTNDYDAAFDGKVHCIHSGRGKLNATELALFLQAGGYETVRLPGPSIRVTNFQGGHGHVRWTAPGTPTATVPLEGVYTAPASGGAIRYSLNGAVPVTGVASPSGRTFSFTIVNVPAGRNTVELWFAGQPSVRTVVRVNVGPVIVLGGQSLAVCVSNYPQRYDGADGHVLFLDQSRRWRQAGTLEITPSYLDYQDVSSLSAGYTSWGRIAARLSARLGVPVAVVNAAQSGSSSAQWQPATNHHDDTTHYGQMLRLAEMAGGADLFWWDQGHNDAAFGILRADYATNLNAIVNAVYADLGCRTAVCVMPETTAGYSANVAAIQLGQRDVIAGNGHALQGSDEDGLTPSGDGVHWGSSTDPQVAENEITARVERHSAALALLGF